MNTLPVSPQPGECCLPAVVPPIRSSDLRLILTDPLEYLLRRRHGFVAPGHYAEALSRGTWLHEHFRRMESDDDTRRGEVATLLHAKLTALEPRLVKAGLSAERVRERLDDERRDCLTAGAWWDAAIDLSFGHEGWTLRELLMRPGLRVVCREAVFAADLPVQFRPPGPLSVSRHECRIQPDLILLDEEAGELWIVDLKSCSGSVLARLSTCPDEFQTQLYCAVLERLLARGAMRERFALPDGTRLGGMVHVAIRKPSIEFGAADRDFIIDDAPLKSGPRKGQPRNEKRYVGEPRFENYLGRVRAWFRGEADFADRAAEWATDPPVNVSRTPIELLREPVRQMHLQSRLDLVASHARREASPSRFAPAEPIRFGLGESPFAPLIGADPASWPELAEAHGFTVRHREADDGEVIREDRFRIRPLGRIASSSHSRRISNSAPVEVRS